MNKQQLFSVALRFIGLLLFIRCIENILQFILILTVVRQYTFFTLFQTPTYGPIAQLTLIVLYAITGFILFTKSDRFAGKVIPSNATSVAKKKDILEIAVSYQGVSLIVSSLISVIRSIVLLFPYFFEYIYHDLARQSVRYFNQYLLNFILNILVLALGIVILLYSKKLASFLSSKIPAGFWGS